MSGSPTARVLHVIPGIGAGGGAERSLVDMAPGLRACGIDLEVAYFVDRPTSAVERLRASGVPVHKVAARGWVGRVRELRRLVRRVRPDVLHTSLFEADLVGRVAALGLRVSVLGSLVHTNHDPLRRRDPTYSAGRLRVVRAVEGFTARHLMGHALANSEAARWSAVRGLRLDPSSVTVVRRGRAPTDTARRRSERRPLVRAALGIDEHAPMLLNVGRQEFQKDHRSLIGAMPAVLRRHPHAVLLIAGREGQLTEELRRLVGELGLGDHVRLLGARDDVADLLAAADLFVFPSILEGLPGAVIEAMEAGVPVVAASIPAVWELIGPEEGVLVPTEDPAALAAAVVDLLSSPGKAQALAEGARRRYDAELTLDRAVAATAAVYRRLAAGPDAGVAT